MSEAPLAATKPPSKKSTPRTLSDLAVAAEERGVAWLKRETRWRTAHYVLLVLGSILASVAGATALADLWNGTLAGVLALTASALTAAAAALRPAEMATGCAAKAAKYLALARDVRRVDEGPAPSTANRDEYFGLLERFDDIRTTPEPGLPTVAE